MYRRETYIFQVPFNVLDQAVSEHIFSTPMLVFVPERKPAGSVVYKMRTQFKGQVVAQLKSKSGIPVGYGWDGNMGEISLRDLGDRVKMTIVCDPPNRDDGQGPYIQFDDELCIPLTLPNGSVIRFRGPQSDDPYEVLTSYQEWMINRLLRLLEQDGIVPVSFDAGELAPAEASVGDRQETGDGVSMKVTLRFKATLENFRNWLQRYTRDVTYRPSFPSDRDGRYYTLLPARYRCTAGGSHILEMGGVYHVEDKGRAFPTHPEGPGYIRFEVQPIGERVKVVAQCKNPAVVGYFEELLAAIKGDWPEAMVERAETETPTPARDGGHLGEKRLQESNQDPLEDARLEVRRFKSHVERQTYKDIFVDGKPQENIACALLQTFLPERSYREVPVRGGQSDLLSFVKQGRFLYEAKIWRGPKYFQQGLKELEEYIIGEGDDQGLLGIFYIVFDSTKSRRAQTYRGDAFSTEVVCGRNVDVVIINLSPPEPSKKR